MTSAHNSQSGFSLIQLSIAIVIISVGLIGASKLAIIQSEKSKQEKIDSSFEDINDLLLAYYTGYQIKYSTTGGNNELIPNQRLPCPARRDLPINDPNFGAEDCENAVFVDSGIKHPNNPSINMRVMIGALPTKALTMANEDAFDVYGGQYLYAVSEQMTAKMNFGRNDLTNILRINRLNGPPIGQPLPYIIISKGASQRGAYDKSGNLVEACPSNGEERENCDDDSIFLDTVISENQENTSTFFDDRVGYDGSFASHVANIIITNTSCPDGEFLTGVQQGQPNCQPASLNILCPSRYLLAGISNGKPVCRFDRHE